jgi:hypothetical protein
VLYFTTKKEASHNGHPKKQYTVFQIFRPGARMKNTANIIDDHPLGMQIMDLHRAGKSDEACKLEDEFLMEIKDSGEDHCNCPASCKNHGKCMECVTIHRGHGDHLPHCMQAMVNRRIEKLSELTEHSFNIGTAER